MKDVVLKRWPGASFSLPKTESFGYVILDLYLPSTIQRRMRRHLCRIQIDVSYLFVSYWLVMNIMYKTRLDCLWSWKIWPLRLMPTIKTNFLLKFHCKDHGFIQNSGLMNSHIWFEFFFKNIHENPKRLWSGQSVTLDERFANYW